MMETIKAIIFDMDGVIFDSETMYINDLIRFFKQHDIEIQVSDCIPLIGIDSKLYYEQAYTMWNNKTDFITFKNMLQEYFRSFDCDYKAVVRPQIYSVLESLSERYKIALASSSSLNTINTALDQVDLRKYFTFIVSGEQFKESKPNPEIYLHTIKELNVNKDEAIIIEDSPKGILAANRAGIKVLALKDDKFGLDQSQADAMLIVAIVIAVIGIIPVIIRKKLLKIYLTLLQNNDIKAIEDLIATKLAKICIPPFNREYLLLNAYLKLNDDKQIDIQVNNIIDHVPMNSKQKSVLAKSVFYIYVDKKNESTIDRLLEMVSTTNDHALYRQMDMVNDTLIIGGIKYFDELKSDLEDTEYTKNNADTPYLEFLLSVIYKNMGNESKSKEYRNKALEDSKGTVYESLIKSQN